MEREVILQWLGKLQRQLKSNEEMEKSLDADNKGLKVKIKFLKENLV